MGSKARPKPHGRKIPQRRQKKSGRGRAIRETEEARVLLESQLRSLYWWVFNACKMKGFIRAKELYEAAERQFDANETTGKTNR